MASRARPVPRGEGPAVARSGVAWSVWNPHFSTDVQHIWTGDAPCVGAATPHAAISARYMDCTNFLEHFSEWVDGDLDPDLTDRANAHVAGCPECQQYEEVYAQGTNLLRSLHDELDVDEDRFRSSLEHRLVRMHRRGAEAARIGSGAPLVSILAMTVVVLSVAWIPVIMVLTEPTVELAPIAAARPAARSPLPPVAIPAMSLPTSTRGSRAIRTVPLEIRGSVPAASDLMRQYAPVLQPYRAVATDGID